MRGLTEIRKIISYSAVALMVLFSMPLVAVTGAYAADGEPSSTERLVTFHDRGEERVILTQAGTVQEALNDAKINIVEEDNVQPGLDEPLVASDYSINIYRARPVIIVDGAVRQKIMTAAQTANGIAKEAGITLRDEDETTVVPSTNIISDGASIVLTIHRATEFTLELYGTETTAYTQAETVGEMLAEKSIELHQMDTLSLSPNTPITSGMTVSIWRDGTQTKTVEEKIPFPVRQIQDFDQPVGYKKIKTPGVDGRKNVTYEITTKDGKEVSRKTIQTVVLEKPKEQVEVVGAKPSFSGDFAAALAKLRQCESGNNYANKNNKRYRGAYQFSYQTWANKYGIYDPADASPAQQDQAARELYLRRGWQPWPHCGANLPDTYR